MARPFTLPAVSGCKSTRSGFNSAKPERIRNKPLRVTLMTHGILSTLSIAALGLFAARAADLFRIPSLRRKECDESAGRGGVWSYNADAPQQESAWLRVQRHGTC